VRLACLTQVPQAGLQHRHGRPVSTQWVAPDRCPASVMLALRASDAGSAGITLGRGGGTVAFAPFPYGRRVSPPPPAPKRGPHYRGAAHHEGSTAQAEMDGLLDADCFAVFT
jgi:hypothetical protein